METDRPTTRQFTVRPFRVAVETAEGVGEYVIDPRLAVHSLLLGADDRVSEAEVHCWAGPLRADLGGEDALDPAQVLSAGPRDGYATFLSPRQRLFIVRERAGDDVTAGNEWEPILSGFCAAPEYRERATADGTRKEFVFHVAGVLDRWSDMHHTQIVGRWMRTATAQAALDERNAGDGEGEPPDSTEPMHTRADVQCFTALPAVFNAGGRPNCSPTPISVGFDGSTHSVHVFTPDDHPDATWWTWARVWRYLMAFHAFEDPADTTAALVRDGNVLDATEALATLGADDRPAGPADAADALTFAMLGTPSAFAIDAMNVVEAMIVCADAAGVHFRVATGLDADAVRTPCDRLYLWARGAGEQVELSKQAVEASTDARTALAANDFSTLAVRADYRDCIDQPVVVGDVRRYEITTELLPGWQPDENLDDVAEEDVATKITYAVTHRDFEGADARDDPWYTRYHRKGDQFSSYRAVGRRWILNTGGLYRPADYAREAEPFDEDAYATWKPSDCSLTDSQVTADGFVVEMNIPDSAWVPRVRPFLPCFSADDEGRSRGIHVEVSFNSGTTWYVIPELAPRALADDSAIVFDAEDLTRIFPPEEDQTTADSFWEAMIRGTARVRVTCVIEGDARLAPTLMGLEYHAPQRSGRIFDVAERFKCNRADGGNSKFAGSPGVVSIARDNVAEIQAYTESLLEASSARQQAALVVVPWLTTDFSVGQSVTRIRGMGLDLAAHATQSARRWPDIVGVQYTPGATTLVLDDYRLFDEMSDGTAGVGD